MHDDDPDDAVHELFMRQIWADAPLGRPVIGSVASINWLTREQIARYFRRRYKPENMVVSVAGNLDHAAVVRLVRKEFGKVGFLSDHSARPTAPRIGGTGPGFRSGVTLTSRPGEQATFMLGLPGVARTDPRRYAFGVLNAALGG